jgi:hypothetical protein
MLGPGGSFVSKSAKFRPYFFTNGQGMSNTASNTNQLNKSGSPMASTKTLGSLSGSQFL